VGLVAISGDPVIARSYKPQFIHFELNLLILSQDVHSYMFNVDRNRLH